MVSKPRRPRNYSAERARRNELARSRGFTSLDTQAKAIRRGEFPSAKQRRAAPAPAPKIVTASGLSSDELDKRNRKWSRAHSHQVGTRYRGEWPLERRDAFYRAFVQWWKIPNDERDFGPTYEYMTDYPDGFAPERDPDYGHAAN